MPQTKGTVFNIQKFSIHDGPGIRTTVFLKGCPLKCKWCSNPESQLSKVQISYNSENCVHCLACEKACINSAISHDDKLFIHVDFEKCKGCLACKDACVSRALNFEGEEKTAEEVFKICMQDKDFYEESGGGVTISGGEGMMQPNFVCALLKLLKDENIHTAIETTGYIEEDTFKQLAPQFDLLLFDVKHYSSEKHMEGTGVKNELITNNLKWAVENGINILPRLPVIPGFNSGLDDAKGIAELLLGLNINKIQLLPFHQMGEKKYSFLNREYEMADIKALHPEDLNEYREVFVNKGIDAFF